MWASSISATLLLAASLFVPAQASFRQSLDVHNDADLETFVSRPDIRAPKFMVKKRQSYESASPGYLFLAPYADLRWRAPSTLYLPGQTGPHIYDSEGNLVWSGAHLFGHRPTFDFKTSHCNGEPCLTFILHEDLADESYTGGAGIIMDTSFDIRDTISTTAGRGTMNMHEFTVTEQGTALYITYSSKMTDVGGSSGFVGDNGFREVDVRTGETIFEWWALDHVDPTESLVRRPPMPGSYGSPWDFFHMNSIDKNADGDYLISSRYLNAIFKISGADGSIVWQLGGKRSSFKFLRDLSFSSQHHARFVDESPTHAIISLLNNAADDVTVTARQSSAMRVRLDLGNMTASLDRRFNRPDQKLTRLRGNAQSLPNGNTFVSWSENAIVSEFDPGGNCLFEGAFASQRFVTYRAYKLNLTTTPSEPPRLAAHAYIPPVADVSSNSSLAVTTLHVSWNGATEVAAWRFHGAEAAQRHLKPLGEVRKTGFETALIVSGALERVYAEAVAADGRVLGESPVVGVTAASLSGIVSGVSEEHRDRRPTHERPPERKPHAGHSRVEDELDRSGSSVAAAEDTREFEALVKEGLLQSAVMRLVVFLASSCVALCVALGFALYRLRRLTGAGSMPLECSYTAVKSVSLE